MYTRQGDTVEVSHAPFCTVTICGVYALKMHAGGGARWLQESGKEVCHCVHAQVPIRHQGDDPEVSTGRCRGAETSRRGLCAGAPWAMKEPPRGEQ